MCLAREADHLDGLPEQAQGPEHLLGLGDRAAQVHLATRQQERSLHVVDVPDRRLLPQLVHVRPRRRTQLELAPQHDVVLRVLAHQVGERAHRDSRPEAVCLADDPVGHESAVGPTADAKPALVDKACALDQLVERRHQVDVVLASPVANDCLAEDLAVSVGSTGVDVEDQEAHAGEDLKLVEERPAVFRVRAAVHLHDQRIKPVAVKARRLQQPSLQDPSIR